MLHIYNYNVLRYPRALTRRTSNDSNFFNHNADKLT
jgi:hypothetical protein